MWNTYRIRDAYGTAKRPSRHAKQEIVSRETLTVWSASPRRLADYLMISLSLRKWLADIELRSDYCKPSSVLAWIGPPTIIFS
jgi:hypothetical protein